MKVVITSATSKEVEKIKENIDQGYTNGTNGLKVSFHVCGVGLLSSCFSINQLISLQKPDLIIQAGIAGCFSSNIALGKVVTVKNEYIGDIGVEENGEFLDVFDMKFQDENEEPFSNKALSNPWLGRFNLATLNEVTGITINEISTRKERIEQLKHKYNPLIESMEGAALHYVCLHLNVPFIQIRAISNYVGERDKSRWNFKGAFENLSTNVLTYIEKLRAFK